MDVDRVLEAIRARLDELGQPFALAGAFALNAHGITRATADLDLIVAHEIQNELVATLEQMGFETLHRSEGYSNHLHSDPELGRVDLIYLQGTTREKLFLACERKSFGRGRDVLVPKIEHLIAMKIHAIKNDPTRRLRDLADIEMMLNLPKVDYNEAHRLFTKAGMDQDWDELVSKR